MQYTFFVDKYHSKGAPSQTISADDDTLTYFQLPVWSRLKKWRPLFTITYCANSKSQSKWNHSRVRLRTLSTGAQAHPTWL